MFYTRNISVGLDSETGRVVNVMLDMDGNGHYAEHCDWELIAIKIDEYFSSTSPQEIEDKQRAFEIKKLNALLNFGLGMNSFKSDHYGFVYLMRSDNLYKIGRSTDPDRRFKQLQYEDPAPQEIVHLIRSNTCRQLESELHGLFYSKRVRGEWFALDRGDVAWLKSL